METATKKTLDESELANFTGSENWYKHFLGPLFTDGARFVAEQAGAFWLLDEIAIAQMRPKVKGEEFQLWVLKVDLEKHSGVLRCEDGNDNLVFSKAIPFTDFCLSEIRLYFTDNVIMLPSEY